MVGIHGRLRVLVAVRATENSVVCRIGVTVVTRRPFAGMTAGIDGEPGVVERGTSSLRCGVACLAGLRETGGDVVWVGHASVHRLMA